MSYVYSVRGWLELSWPDLEIEGVDEAPEEHARKVEAVHDAVAAELDDAGELPAGASLSERYRAGWAFPQHDLDGTEYVFYGADVEEPAAVLAQIREVLAIDPYADGYFSVEGEDGTEYRQWLILAGRIYISEQLFPDFEAEEPPPGYRPLFDEEGK